MFVKVFSYGHFFGGPLAGLGILLVAAFVPKAFTTQYFSRPCNLKTPPPWLDLAPHRVPFSLHIDRSRHLFGHSIVLTLLDHSIVLTSMLQFVSIGGGGGESICLYLFSLSHLLAGSSDLLCNLDIYIYRHALL